MEISGVADQDVYVGIRPEGFEPDEKGALHCGLTNIEVMGRDVSIVCTHPALLGDSIRAIVDADCIAGLSGVTVNYALKPHKVHLFHKETEERICFQVK
jgi:multiple sugar transport system ATP-binding protein